MRGKRYGWVLAAALFLSGAARAQDVAGLVNECEACHGPGGVSTEADVPSLAGRGTTYI